MIFRLVTGTDFGRSNAWAKRTLNPISLQITEHKNHYRRKLNMKIIEKAKFAAGAFVSREVDMDTPRTGSVIQPAQIELNGIILYSAQPKSAAEALKINEALAEVAE